jgi:hypothetical protein
MAAYTQTTTLDFPKSLRLGNSPMGVLAGRVNVTNYNQTLAEITAITGKFKAGGPLRVVVSGASSTGYLVIWDTTGKSLKAFVPTTQAEVASDTAVGTVDFVAIGQMG